MLPALSSWSLFFSSDPTIFVMQIAMLSVTALIIFLILFTLRDILLRTNSFFLQILCILLVAVLPFVGFGLYLLIRPGKTNAQRVLEAKVDDLLKQMQQLKTSLSPRSSRPQQSPGFKLHHARPVEKSEKK